MNFDYSINYTKGKTAKISISLNGNIKISVPLYFTKNDINNLISIKKDWILKKLSQIKENSKNRLICKENNIIYLGEIYTFIKENSMSNYTEIDNKNKIIYSGQNLKNKDKLLNFYRNQANFILPTRVYKLAKEKKFDFSKITIKNNKKRWGSCSSKKEIVLSIKLILTPLKVIDAIIYHELVHTEIMSHSKDFYKRLYEVYPDYEYADYWIKTHYPVENNIFY